MSLVENSREFATGIFGNNSTVENLAKRAAASIYYRIFLHNPVLDEQLLEGIKDNLKKLISDEDLNKLEGRGDNSDTYCR